MTCFSPQNDDEKDDVTTTILDRIAMALNVDASLLLESDPPLPKAFDDVGEVGKSPCEEV